MSGSGAVSWGKVCYGEVGFVWARHGSRGRESSGTVGSCALCGKVGHGSRGEEWHGQVWPGAVCWGKAWLIYLKNTGGLYVRRCRDDTGRRKVC